MGAHLVSIASGRKYITYPVGRGFGDQSGGGPGLHELTKGLSYGGDRYIHRVSSLESDTFSTDNGETTSGMDPYACRKGVS